MAKIPDFIRKHKFTSVLLALMLVLVLWIAGYMVYGKYLDYQNKKLAFALIDDIKALHSEMEQTLGVELEKESSCTQPSDKSSTETTPLMCHMGFVGDLASANLIDVIAKKEYFSEKGVAQYYSYRKKTPCWITVVSDARTVFECSFSARHSNKQAVQEKLETY